MRVLVIGVLALFAYSAALAQSPSGGLWLKKRQFGQYFIADHYAPMVKVGIGSTYGGLDYDISADQRESFIFLEPILGAQIPIYTYTSENYQYSFSIPISFSVWFDFLEARTAPIINTDYRFALLEFNYNRKTKHSKIRNWGIKFIPFFHESTHIGDELAIVRVQDSIPTTRINVSYETFELAFQINDPYDQKIKNNSFKLGAKFLWNRKEGFYTVDSLEVNSDVRIERSRRWIEPYLHYQFQDPDSFLSNEKMMFMISMDLTLRVQFGYPIYFRDDSQPGWQEREVDERYIPSINSLLGWKFYNKHNEPSGVGVFVKTYFGINPHGQFRNIPWYPYLGLMLTYEP